MTSPLEQKIKVTGPVVITANRVVDGAVVYRRADGGWTTQLDGAAIATNATGAKELMTAAVADDLGAVGPYVAPVKLSPGGHVGRATCANSIRLGGPTIDLPVPFGMLSLRTYRGIDACTSMMHSTARWSAERVAEFRDQVARRLSGELTEEEFKPLRLMNGVYLQLHAYMLRTAIPYGTLSSGAVADAGACRAQIRSRLRPFHHAAEHPVPLDQARRAAGRHGRSRQRRHARHADERQLRAQYHDRPMGRRCARRDRGSAHLGRADPPARDAASRILLHAAQIQDRGGRPPRTIARRCAFTIWRCGCTATAPANSASRSWSAAGSAARRSSPRPSSRSCTSATCSAMSRRCCAPTTSSAAATTSTRRASRSWCTSSAPEAFAKEVDAEWQSIKDGALALDPAAIGEIAGRFRYPHYERLEDSPPELAAGAPRRTRLRHLGRQFRRQSQGAGLRHRDAVAQAGRRHARRRHRRADGRHRRSRRPLLVRRNPRRPRAESGAAACRAARPAGAVARARRRSASPCPTSISSPTSSPARASIIAALPMRARSRSRRRSRGGSAISISQRDLGRLHVNISGCINACGHHHVGHIGILGVEKNGEEFYQITLGGKADENARSAR